MATMRADWAHARGAEVFPLEDLTAAYEFARTARRRGKVVVQITATEPKPTEQAVGATAG